MHPRIFIAAPFLFILTAPAPCQSPQARYQAAKAIYAAHTQQFFHDNSPQAVKALSDMWSTAADAVIADLARHPDANPAQLEATLCELDETPADCVKANYSSQVLQLAPAILLIAYRSGEVGTVFAVSTSQNRVLWSIASANPQPHDPKHLLSGWRAGRASDSCRAKLPEKDWGTCGPLFASLGALPPDATGHPRFYLDGEYAEGAGVTAADQTSIWRWNQDHPELLWIGTSSIMIDSQIGTAASGNILSIAEKREFRSFGSSDAGEGRLMLHKLRLAPTGVEDLGTYPAFPALDIVDEFLSRLQRHRPTADIASPDVARLLQPLIADAGSVDDSSVIDSGALTHLCFITDSTGRLDFTLERVAGRPRLTHVSQHPYPWDPCPKSTPGAPISAGHP